MIVSFEKNFIFLKTLKVAGSSVEAYLRQFCGPDDIVTPLSLSEEVEVAKLGCRPATPVVARRISPWELFHRDVDSAHRSNFRQMLMERQIPWTQNWSKHQTARSVRSRLNRKTWDESYRFTVTRNPWDQVVSMHFWRVNYGFLDTSVDRAIDVVSRNWEIYTIRNRIAVDQVIRFESLLSDFGDVCERLEIPRPLELPRLKTGLRPPKVGPRELLTAAQIDRVAKLARREIRYFGYELEP